MWAAKEARPSRGRLRGAYRGAGITRRVFLCSGMPHRGSGWLYSTPGASKLVTVTSLTGQPGGLRAVSEPGAGQLLEPEHAKASIMPHEQRPASTRLLMSLALLISATGCATLDSRASLEQRGPMPIHGNHCGPGDSTSLPAVDTLDKACLEHDWCYSVRGYFSCGCDRQAS